jgi:hypothetical protein
LVAPVEGWAIGAWLKPGAHEDIDGSALALSGHLQPGGWHTAHGDGGSTGRPSVDHGPYDHDDGDAPIIVRGGEGMPDIKVIPADIPEWAAAVAELERLTTAFDADPDDESIAADDAATDIRAAICEAINDAIDAVVDEGRPEEPDGLEWGEYRGAGPVIAWRDADGEAQFRWWPDADDIREAVNATVAPAVAARIMADLSADDG